MNLRNKGNLEMEILLLKYQERVMRARCIMIDKNVIII